MLPTEFRLSLKHLVIFFYLITLLILVILIKLEMDKEKPAFLLSSSSVELKKGQGEVSLAGDHLHKEINALSMSSLINDEAVLWRVLDDMPATEISVQDDLLLVASSERGKILSARAVEGGIPAFLGSIQLPGGVSQISIVGDKALVFMQRHGGLAVLDIQDPANLRLVEVLDETGLVTDSVTSDSQVFYADIYKGLGRVDVQGEEPKPYTLANIDSPWRIAKVGARLATGTLKDKVYLYDVLEDSNLREVGSIEFPMNIRGVAMTDEVLAIALEDGSLHVYEQSGWPELKKTAQVTLPGAPLNLKRMPGSSKIVASFVSGGLAIVDLQTPTQPVLSGHLKLAKTFKGLAVKSDTIYGGSRIGLEEFSIASIEESRLDPKVAAAMVSTDFLKLKRWNELIVTHSGENVASLGSTGRKPDSNKRYLALHDDDLVTLFEWQGKDRFRKAGAPIEMDGVTDVVVLDDYLYLLHPAGLQIRDCSDPDSMNVVAEIPLTGVARVLEPLDSKTMLVATRDEGVHLVDIANPAIPELIATVAPPRHLQAINIAYDLLVADGRVYVSYGPGGVYVLEVGRSEAPRLIQRIETRGFAKTMEMVDGLLLVADSLYGLFVIDTTTYDVAVPVGNLQLPLRVDSMAVADDALYVSSYPSGTMRLPLPRRLAAVENVTDEMLTLPLGAVAEQQQVYLYDNRSSLPVKVKPETLN